MRAEAEPLLANRQDARITLFDHPQAHSHPQTDFRQAVRAITATAHIDHAGNFAFRETIEWELKSRDHGSPLSHLRFSLNIGIVAVG